ncbi:MAG: transglycosylase [Agathobacter sp.]|uniref:transglycosylase n=1 Tax=Agathobacter sp. TaxID=2021311 RepID=UPI00257D5069|nr:transglycosylase [Agathobacter sp.]MBQ1681223.1 transglycosylase [Agathobacter sp.]
MRRRDLTVPALLLEAVTIIIAVTYMVLQIAYGIHYHRGPLMIIMNCVVMLVVYAFFTLLSIYPEWVNRLPEETSRGKVRTLTLWMVRLEKLIFSVGLVIPCVFDVIGREIPGPASLILVACMILSAAGFEWAIIREIKKQS